MRNNFWQLNKWEAVTNERVVTCTQIQSREQTKKKWTVLRGGGE